MVAVGERKITNQTFAFGFSVSETALPLYPILMRGVYRVAKLCPTNDVNDLAKTSISDFPHDFRNAVFRQMYKKPPGVARNPLKSLFRRSGKF
jgi:hypothetical protein